MNRMGVPRLHLIGPLDVVTLDRYVDIAIEAAMAGPLAVHLRTPGGGTAEMLAAARTLRAHLPRHATLIVNDRIDVALLAEAHGVQLGERSLRATDARSLVGERLIGRSIHDLDGARHAASEAADFLLAGNVFVTDSKPGLDGRGIGWLEWITRAVSSPVIALGGITVDRVPHLIAAGAWGVAMGREILKADDPGAVVRLAHEQIHHAPKENTNARNG